MDLPELVERRYRTRIESLLDELNHSEDNANTLQAQVDQLLQEKERYKKSFEDQQATIESLTTNSEKIDKDNLIPGDKETIRIEKSKPDFKNAETETSVEDPFFPGDHLPFDHERDTS